jgi:hypothetical protein
MLIAFLNLLPMLLSGAAWWIHYRSTLPAPKARSVSFRLGLVAVTLGSFLLLGFWAYGFASHGGMSSLRFANEAFWFPSVGLALAGTLLALFGIGMARWLTLLAGTALLYMLYIAGLATSV